MTIWLPQTMIGMLTSTPKMTSDMLWPVPEASAAPAMAMTLSRLITKSAMITVLTARPQLVAAFDAGVRLLVLRHQQLDADPQQQQRADDLQEGNGQQRQRKEDQHDAQHDRARGAPQDALRALLRRQLAAGQRDDDRVVAAEQDVDQDDLADGDPELGVGKEFHLACLLRNGTLVEASIGNQSSSSPARY